MTFKEKNGEKQGQRRKRFLQFLRDLPKPSTRFNEKTKQWMPEGKK